MSETKRWPAKWNGDPIAGLATVQLSTGGLIDSKTVGKTPLHLGRAGNCAGVMGPLLCGLDHFTLPVGFSVRGGVSSPALGDDDPQTAPCPTCIAVAARMQMGAGWLRVDGLARDRVAAAISAELDSMGAREFVDAVSALPEPAP